MLKTPQLAQRRRLSAVHLHLGVPVGLAGCGLLLQYLPAQVAMLTLAAILAAGVGYCAARPGLWQARWPD